MILPDFVRANTDLLAPPLVPEISLYLAAESLPIWRKTEEELGQMNVPPPYWAFAWAGGQALARFLLDGPHLVAGRCVLDLGAGSGIVSVRRCWPAPRGDRRRYRALATAAIGLNAEANGVMVETTAADLLTGEPGRSTWCWLVICSTSGR
jgi:predicted nicotinamide N-methyase